MKKLAILLLILSPFFLNAQPFWNSVIDGSNKSHVIEKALFQDSIILVSGYVSDASCPYHALYAYNKQGLQLWYNYSVCDFISTDDDFIYTAGYDINQDDVGGDDQLVLSKYNEKGLEIFSLRYPPEIDNEYFCEYKPTGISITEDGKILVSSNKLEISLTEDGDFQLSSYKSVIKCDNDGAGQTETYVNIELPIEGISAINSLLYLIHSQNSLYIADSALVMHDSISFTENIIKTLISKDTIYTLFNTHVIRIDTSLTLIDTLIRASEFEFQKMELYDGDIWIKGNNLDSIKLMHIKSSNSIDTFTFELLADVKEFVEANNNFTFIGNSFSNQIALYGFSSSDIARFEPNLPDIEIVDFNIDSISLIYESPFDSTVSIGYSFNTQITIKNNGTDTIYSFSIYSDLQGGENCAQNYFYQKFTDLEVHPNQMLTVKLRRANQYGVKYNQLCFECLAPNSKLETEFSNNILCKTFTITEIENKPNSNLKVYPNPVKDYLFIENSSYEMKMIELVDVNGSVLFKMVPTEEKVKIDLGILNSGLYILKVNSKNYFDAKIIVKE